MDISRFVPPVETVVGLKLYECGCCGGYHPWEWDNDCRDDFNRFGAPEDYAEKTGQDVNDIEVLSMEDRVHEDSL